MTANWDLNCICLKKNINKNNFETLLQCRIYISTSQWTMLCVYQKWLRPANNKKTNIIPSKKKETQQRHRWKESNSYSSNKKKKVNKSNFHPKPILTLFFMFANFLFFYIFIILMNVSHKKAFCLCCDGLLYLKKVKCCLILCANVSFVICVK